MEAIVATKIISRMVDGKRVQVQETLSAQEESDLAIAQAAEVLPIAVENKISDLKAEAMSRITARIPGIGSIDQLNLIKEFWLSVAPAARAPTSDFQYVIDVYQEAKDTIVLLKAMTDATIVEAYDPVNDPSWPV